jgi:hypothetical protein
MNMRSILLVITMSAMLSASNTLARQFGAAQHGGHGGDVSPSLVKQVREATRPFLDIRQAKTAKYTQFLGCVSGPQEGAMGVHFVNSEFVGDGQLDVSHPEALIYEFRDGTARLVGAEYIVMAEAWNTAHNNTPPVLEGQLLQYNSTPNRYGLPAFYELHVWAWRDNPHGAFVDWNPEVSCEGR